MRHTKIKSISLSLIIICLLGLGLSAFTFSPVGQTLGARIEFLATFWEDIAGETNLDSEVISSWIPESGIRGRYQLAKSVLSIETLEGIVGEPAFTHGPHGQGINYNSKTSFGYYNPEFVTGVHITLRSIYGNKRFVQSIQGAYDMYMKDYLRVYYLSYEVAANNQGVVDSYLEVLSQASDLDDEPYPAHSELLQESFRAFAEAIEQEGYDVYEGFTCPGFWVRRTIDGTADEFYNLLVFTLETFDPKFMN